MKKVFKAINKLLYNLFDTNLFGKISMCSLFMGAVSLFVGQPVLGGVLLGVGMATLGASAYKNIDACKQRKTLAADEQQEVIIEESQSVRTSEAESVATQTTTQDVCASKNNSNEVIK